MKLPRKENGEVMLEGMVIMVITLLLLVWILGVGFIYYQKYLTTAITNDAASKIASTYGNPTGDIIMGYVSTEDLASRDLYRNFNNNSLFNVNKAKVESYVKYKLDKTNFAGTVKKVEVSMKLVQDPSQRKHIEVTTVCTFNTPFGQALKLFGMKKTATYTSTGRADCTDIIDYISTVDFSRRPGGVIADNSIVIKMINSLIGLFNHSYARS